MTAPLGAVAQHLAALFERAAVIPGGDQLTVMRKSVAQQLGFDPLTREGLLQAGLDPDRGAALALFLPDWKVALPLTRPEVFSQTAQRIFVDRFGAGPHATVKWAVVKGYGLLARGEQPLTVPDKPLSQAAGMQAAKAQLGAQDFVVWAPAGSALPRRYAKRPLPGDAAVALQTAASGLALRLWVNALDARAELPGGGSALVALLPPDAPVKMRLGLSPEELLKQARQDAGLAALLDKLGGADAQALASVAPGVAISLGVLPTANIGAAIDNGFDVRKRSPFETVQLVALAQVTDRPRLVKALADIAGKLPQFGARAVRSGDDFRVTYPAGAGPRFGVRDDIQAGGKPVAYLLGGSLKPEDLKPGPRGSDALWQDEGASVHADLSRLAAQVAALPETAYGSGPQSYVARSLVSQVIEPLKVLKLKLAAQAYADHFGGTLSVEIAPP
ncbi:MAG TPA: hypothetical protein VLW85_14805 [Myxococcales bacterium]|nr:hypothetical protein [Myxococcales bacterium]